MTLIEISSASIHKAIDHNLHVVNSTLRSQRIRLRRADDLISAHEFLSSSSKLIHPARLNEVVENVIPIYIILEKQAGDTFDVCGTSLFTLGYSTWKGRVMNLDLFLAENHNHGNIMMQCLAKIAKLLDCTRIVHLKKGDQEAKLFRESYGAEVLPDWLTLRMGKDGMKSFIGTRDDWGKPSTSTGSIQQSEPTKTGIITKQKDSKSSVRNAIDDTLSYMNTLMSRKNMTNTIRLRRATGGDVESIFNLVKGLASYEKAADQVSVTPSIYQRDGGDVANPIFHTILVESIEGECAHSSVVGMGFFYMGYSAANAKFLYLEDLFIKEAFRGAGCGKSIMYSLAEIALRLNCRGFVWQALDWNAPALAFYKSIGAGICENLVTIRLDDEVIDKLHS